MILSISHKGLKLFWEEGNGKLLPAQQLNKIRRILDAINDLEDVPQDLEPFKSWRPHPLKGNLSGFWSVDVTGNYRIIFKFEKGNAFEINYLDTH